VVEAWACVQGRRGVRGDSAARRCWRAGGARRAGQREKRGRRQAGGEGKGQAGEVAGRRQSRAIAGKGGAGRCGAGRRKARRLQQASNPPAGGNSPAPTFVRQQTIDKIQYAHARITSRQSHGATPPAVERTHVRRIQLQKNQQTIGRRAHASVVAEESEGETAETRKQENSSRRIPDTETHGPTCSPGKPPTASSEPYTQQVCSGMVGAGTRTAVSSTPARHTTKQKNRSAEPAAQWRGGNSCRGMGREA